MCPEMQVGLVMVIFRFFFQFECSSWHEFCMQPVLIPNVQTLVEGEC